MCNLLIQFRCISIWRWGQFHVYAGGGDLHRIRLKVCRGKVETSDMKTAHRKKRKKEKERKKKNEMDMTLGETGGWQCWTEGGCGVVDGATNRRQFLGNGRLRYVGGSPLKKEDTWGLRLGLSTSCSRFSKTFPVISQNVAQKTIKSGFL